MRVDIDGGGWQTMALALASCARVRDPDRGPLTRTSPSVLEGVENLTEIAQLTGPGAINDTEAAAVAGTDLGLDGERRRYHLLLLRRHVRRARRRLLRGQGGIWRSNVAAYTTDSDPSDGITFDGWRPTDDTGWATALVEGDHDANTGKGEVTKIPTGGFAIGDTLYIQYMSVKFWGEPGAWDANFAGLARSTDGGTTWTPLEAPQMAGRFELHPDHRRARAGGGATEYVYLWAIPAGRFGGVQLMRVPATTDAVEDAARVQLLQRA